MSESRGGYWQGFENDPPPLSLIGPLFSDSKVCDKWHFGGSDRRKRGVNLRVGMVVVLTKVSLVQLLGNDEVL